MPLLAFVWSICLILSLSAGLEDFSISCQSQPDKTLWTITGTTAGSSEEALLISSLQAAKIRIEGFFGQPFRQPFTVVVFPSRDSFDRYFTERWKVPKTEAWMVASGVADKLTILARDVWKTQAQEHDPSDEKHYRELISHEAVHVYHGQFNPTGDFEGMDNLGWFVEGLAVYVSGQLEGSHRHAARDAINEGKEPNPLTKAWSGKYRYGVCGSMVRFIDKKWGRKTLLKLLGEVQPDSLLTILQTTESAFLKDWVQFVKRDALMK
jgi:hypothetical protein